MSGYQAVVEHRLASGRTHSAQLCHSPGNLPRGTCCPCLGFPEGDMGTGTGTTPVGLNELVFTVIETVTARPLAAPPPPNQRQ